MYNSQTDAPYPAVHTREAAAHKKGFGTELSALSYASTLVHRDASAGYALPEPSPAFFMPELWKAGTPSKAPVPNPSGKSGWQQCYERVKEYDENMCKMWKDELDHLLIFAGLFSAAVTAFVVESYQWLDTTEDPTSDLLTQFISIQLNATTPLVKPATTSISVVRINICWFLSLILSLSAVLVGILCLQWLREYERPIDTSFEDKLRYRQVRYEGLHAWKVPRIINFLPVLLQIALILFFAGVIDLLWQRNLTVAITVLIPISCVIFFLLATSVHPVLQTLKIRMNTTWVVQASQSPFKSPLSWLIYRLAVPILDLSGWGKRNPVWKQHRNSPFQTQWPGFDQLWVKFESTDLHFSMLSQSVQWIQTAFKYDSTTTIPVYQCLNSLDNQIVRMMVKQVRQGLSEIFGDEPFSPKFSSHEFDKLRDVTCILHLRGSVETAHQAILLDHLIRMSHEDTRFLFLIPVDWALSIRSLPKEQTGAFIEQILLCTLSAMDHEALRSMDRFGTVATIVRDVGQLVFEFPPNDGSVISYLLKMNFLKWKRWLDPDVSQPARVILTEFLNYLQPGLFPTDVQPYLADLAWTAIKISKIPPKDAFGDWSRDAWLAFFQLESWDRASSILANESPELPWWAQHNVVHKLNTHFPLNNWNIPSVQKRKGSMDKRVRIAPPEIDAQSPGPSFHPLARPYPAEPRPERARPDNSDLYPQKNSLSIIEHDESAEWSPLSAEPPFPLPLPFGPPLQHTETRSGFLLPTGAPSTESDSDRMTDLEYTSESESEENTTESESPDATTEVDADDEKPKMVRIAPSQYASSWTPEDDDNQSPESVTPAPSAHLYPQEPRLDQGRSCSALSMYPITIIKPDGSESPGSSSLPL